MDLTFLRDEYSYISTRAGIESKQTLSASAELALVGALVRYGEWTHEGAVEVARLATQYGFFVLRNAAALAAALGIEDGSKGL